MQKELIKNNQYKPAEDTFFLADHLKNESGESALDIGTGGGYLTGILNKKFPLVVATDIDFNSLKTAKLKIANPICCNGAEPIHFIFDLIVCNMPYLPSDKIIDRTTDGGKEGVEIPLNILKSAKNCLKKDGKLLFLTSSLANYQKLLEMSKTLGYNVKIIAKKKLFFEELILVQATKNNSK